MQDRDFDQTLVLIKPDALKNSLTGYVLSLLSEFHTGLRFAGTRVVSVTKMLAEEHYAEHVGKIFYPSLLEYIMGRIHYPDRPHRQRVIAIVYQGTGAVEKIREIAGPTNPHVARDQKPGCIRSLGTIAPLKNAAGDVVGERMDNLIHASATTEEAEREIKLWFRPSDIPPFMRVYPTVRCNEHFYFSDDRLFASFQPDSFCIVSPGDVVWESDMEVLRAIAQGAPAAYSLRAVVAKYLLNVSGGDL